MCMTLPSTKILRRVRHQSHLWDTIHELPEQSMSHLPRQPSAQSRGQRCILLWGGMLMCWSFVATITARR
jgi:hypothetical protein